MPSDKKRFSDFADEPSIMDGDKVNIESILNKEIEILAVRITESKFPKNKSGNCLTIQFMDPETGAKHIVFSGSDVLIQQCQKYQSQMPFLTVIKKINRYCILT